MESMNLTATSEIDEVIVNGLKEKIKGNILQPGTDRFNSSRKLWNGMIDKCPSLIIQPTDENDIIVAVDFARSRQLPISIKAGGHNVSGNAVCDTGLMIDLSLMKNVEVDPVSKTAKVQTGVTWGEFDQATQQYGLVTTGGLVSTTGVAGLTLGGGVGWLVRKHGLSCDNLLEASIVTADANLLTANASENSELFWGIRGGGGNFGIVTSMTFRLYPLDKVLGGMIIYSQDKARDVLMFYNEFMKTAPEELTLYTGLLTSPDGFPVVAMFGCYSGDLIKGEEVLKPIREFGKPLADLFQTMPYVQMQTLLDAGFPHGNRYYWKSNFLKDLSEEAINTIVSQAASVTSPHSAIVVEYYGGASSREPKEGTAYPHREAQFDLVIIANWSDRNEDEKHIHWARNFYNEMQVHSSNRIYVNTLGIEGPDLVKQAYGQNYERLSKLKTQYDPQNIFRYNQNIPPAEKLILKPN